MESLPHTLPSLTGPNDRAIAVVPWALTPGADVGFGREFANLDLDQVIFPLGRPQRQNFTIVGDLAQGDQVIVFARKKLRQLGHWRRGTRADLNIMIMEPRPIAGKYYWLYKALGHRIHTFLIHDLDGFGNGPKTEFLPFGMCFVPEWQSLNIKKTKEASLIASNKADQTGHKLRHQIAEESLQLNPNIDLLGRRYSPFTHKHEALAPYRFSIIIENTRQRHYFTEKLTDAILCQTVPIYWGCPNIDDFFDTRGFIICQNADDIRSALKDIGPEMYRAKLPHLKAQLERAAWYANLELRAALAIFSRIHTP